MTSKREEDSAPGNLMVHPRQRDLFEPGLVLWQIVPDDPDQGEGVPTPGVLSTLDDIRTLKLSQVVFSGDIHRRRDFFDLVEYAVGCGIGIRFTTNGAAIDEPRARWLAAAKSVGFTLRLDELHPTDPHSALRALRLLAQVPVHGFTIRLASEGQPSGEILDLAQRCHARLRTVPSTTPDEPRGVQPEPGWVIGPDGEVHIRTSESRRVGNIQDTGGLAALVERASAAKLR